MKISIKRLTKFLISRGVYFFLGLFFALAITAAYAAVSTVTSGQTLSKDLWNAMAADVNSLITKVTNLENKAPSHASCEFVSAGSAAVCPAGKFLVAMDRNGCTNVPGAPSGSACWAKCCKPW